MHRIMHEHDAGAFFREGIHLVPAFAHHAGAVGVDDDGFGPVEHRVILRPAFDDRGLDIQPAMLVQGTGQQLTSGIKLMLPWPMAASPGEEDDAVPGEGRKADTEQGEEKQRKTEHDAGSWNKWTTGAKTGPSAGPQQWSGVFFNSRMNACLKTGEPQSNGGPPNHCRARVWSPLPRRTARSRQPLRRA